MGESPMLAARGLAKCDRYKSHRTLGSLAGRVGLDLKPSGSKELKRKIFRAALRSASLGFHCRLFRRFQEIQLRMSLG
jgi:hypothetical protein